MNYKYIIYEKEGNIARVILNKPEKLNAFDIIDREDAWEIEDALNDAAKDDNVKVVIMKGKGKAFCTGEDLTKVGFVYGIGTGKPGEKRANQRVRLKKDKPAFSDEFLRLVIHPKIIIAQVHGYALAGGMYYTAASDLAIAAEDTKFGLPEQRLGFSGSGAPHSIIILTIGLKRMLDLMITGRLISGKEAAKIGLVNKAVPLEKLEDEVEKLARNIALLPRDGLIMAKETRLLIYHQMGIMKGFATAYISHTMFTNLRWEPDEYNFFKQRLEKGTRDAFHGRDDRFTKLV